MSLRTGRSLDAGLSQCYVWPMLRYYLAAAGLKAFSANSATKRMYRKVGNHLGARRRSTEIRAGYIKRAEANLRFIESHGGIADGMHVLELGTGWVHWESLFTRAFYDVKCTLFDVWDNRQFAGFQNYALHLIQRIRVEVDRTEEEFARAETLLRKVLECDDFEEAYALLGWTYVIESNGSLSALGDNSIDLVISSDVLEHVARHAMPGLAQAHRRILKPGGRAAHQIVFTDHLTIYDRSVHPKHYLTMSDKRWRIMGENDVQYINRLQPSEIESLFVNAGLNIEAEKVTTRCDLTRITLDDRFRGYSDEDLSTSVKSILLKKSS